MSSGTLTISPKPRGPVAWVGGSVIDGLGYVGGVTILLVGALGWLIWPWKGRRDERGPGFMRSLLHQLFWMLSMGIPTIGLVHIAVGSFLSLQAYYGSTFVDGTGAVVGVGLLRNLGGIMSGMVFSGILAARMIPELRMIKRRVVLEETEPAADSSGPGRSRSQRGRPACRPGGPRELEQADGPEDRGGVDCVHLTFTLGHHGRHGGRLEGVGVADGALDRDVLHDAAQDDVVPRRDGPARERHSVRRTAGGDLLLRGARRS